MWSSLGKYSKDLQEFVSTVRNDTTEAVKSVFHKETEDNVPAKKGHSSLLPTSTGEESVASEGLRQYEMTKQVEELGGWDDDEDDDEEGALQSGLSQVKGERVLYTDNSAVASQEQLKRVAKLAFALGYWKCKVDRMKEDTLGTHQVLSTPEAENEKRSTKTSEATGSTNARPLHQPDDLDDGDSWGEWEQ